MKYSSIWKSSKQKTKDLKILKDKINTNILIIGCGISGLSTGMELVEKNKKFIMVEKGKVGMGISSLSTGKLNYAQDLVYSEIMKHYGFSTAQTYYKAQKFALKRVKEIIDKYNIDCDYEMINSYIFTDNDKNVCKIKKEESFYKRVKAKYKTVEKISNISNIKYALEFKDTAMFNPVKYMDSLRRIIEQNGNDIFESTMVHKIKKFGKKYKVITDKGVIYAKKVVITTHYPYFILPLLIPFKTYISKSYLLASKINKPKVSAISVDNPNTTMRTYLNNYLIYGSDLYKASDEKSQFEKLKESFYNHCDSKIDYIWKAHDVMTNDSIPYIDRIKNENMYIATGFNKWGMSNGILSGKILSDLVLNKSNAFSYIFSFKRKFSIFRLANQLKNNFNTVISLISSKLTKNYSFYEDVKVININGEKVGIYYKNGKEYRVKTTCPHMKCSLIFNEAEKTWDCPCHGSRFDIYGNVINGPSTYNIKYIEK